MSDTLTFENFIDGKFLPSAGGRWLDVYEPATGAPFARVANSDHQDVYAAVRAAVDAGRSWTQTSADFRAAVLNRMADAIEKRCGEFAAAESRDTGKPITLASTVDIPRAISNFRFFAAATTQFASESHYETGRSINYTLRQPLGAVACISPWNLPIYLLSWKIAPALACGNTVVAKPSEITPYTASLLAEVAAECGLPKGVLNFVHGSGASAGAALVCHEEIKAVSFTGSTATGAAIAGATASQFKKLSLEMGGKNPTLVFADCDFERTVREVARSAFTNQGQVCLCGSRILVESSIYESFRDALLAHVSQIQSGDPESPTTTHGAIVSADHFKKISDYLKLASEEGGTLLCGGKTRLENRCAGGWFINPVLIEGLGNDSRINQEEIFGPVASLIPFKDEQEALMLANQCRYGLASSVWTRDINRAHRLSTQLETGLVWINCWLRRDLRTPFGGMKHSGLGREGGWEAMKFFTEPRNVCIEFDHE
ncbi:MAG: aldehyde dehydrogenase [Xanthomonadales bacterium]|nr:aldehyde dehydrogenase [Xanthomonadales bacterium]